MICIIGEVSVKSLILTRKRNPSFRLHVKQTIFMSVTPQQIARVLKKLILNSICLQVIIIAEQRQ